VSEGRIGPSKAADDAVPVSLGQLTSYFLRLGTFGFGGPIALTAAMQRDLVLARRWITPGEYKEGLALAQLAPGPLGAQPTGCGGKLWTGRGGRPAAEVGPEGGRRGPAGIRLGGQGVVLDTETITPTITHHVRGGRAGVMANLASR
jgi:hypothetical protein